jgi:hypothetical protein
VARYAPALGLTLPEVHIMDLGHRWGSANAAAAGGQGRLNFHWRCVMATLTVLDYIVCHELTHLLVPDHSPAFWEEVLEATFEEIYQVLKQGESVSLRDGGTFHVREERSSWVFRFNLSQKWRASFGLSSTCKGEL